MGNDIIRTTNSLHGKNCNQLNQSNLDNIFRMSKAEIISDKNEFQTNYALKHRGIYNRHSRHKKAERLIMLLKSLLTSRKLRNSSTMEVGGSLGIISYKLSKHVKRAVCTDIDKQALRFAKQNFIAPNLSFEIEDATNLSYKSNSFDIIICMQIYEHVLNQAKLISEIFRVLKKNGICYFTAVNKFSIFEPHYNLPFLSWMPRELSDQYIKIMGKGKKYYEKPMSYWQLKKLIKPFKIVDYTPKILKNPDKFGFNDNYLLKPFFYLMWLFYPLLKLIFPSFIFVLVKK